MNNKTIVIGDIHGRKIWKEIFEKEHPDKIIFIADYFDSFYINAEDQIKNFRDIMTLRKASSDGSVITLIGNHDATYLPETHHSGISGYQAKAAPAIAAVLEEHRQFLKMAHQEGRFLFTHAGVSQTWCDENLEDFNLDAIPDNIADMINEQWKYTPRRFMFNGTDSYGDDVYQTPIWIRPKSLMKDCKSVFSKKFIQVVGHTAQKSIDIKGKATGGRYYFIDTLGTSGEYLVIENGNIYSKTINTQLHEKTV